MKKLLILVLISLFNIVVSNTDKGSSPKGATKTRTVFGKIKDKVTGETLAGVKIQVEGSDTFVYSDIEGNFNITVTLGEKSSLDLNVVGYAPVSIPSSSIGFNTEISLDPR